MLSAFFKRIEGGTKYKYETKLDGIHVYNAYYTTTLGYSQRQFKQLKQSQQSVWKSGCGAWEHVSLEKRS